MKTICTCVASLLLLLLFSLPQKVSSSSVRPVGVITTSTWRNKQEPNKPNKQQEQNNNSLHSKVFFVNGDNAAAVDYPQPHVDGFAAMHPTTLSSILVGALAKYGKRALIVGFTGLAVWTHYPDWFINGILESSVVRAVMSNKVLASVGVVMAVLYGIVSDVMTKYKQSQATWGRSGPSYWGQNQ